TFAVAWGHYARSGPEITSMWFESRLLRLGVAVDDRDRDGKLDGRLAEQDAARLGGGRPHRVRDGIREILRRVHDELVMQEEHEMRSRGEGRGCGVAPAKLPQHPAEGAHPAQRPLGSRALHDEVAGEAAPRAPVAARPGALGLADSLVVCGVAPGGRAAAEPGAHDLARLPPAGGGLDEGHGARE